MANEIRESQRSRQIVAGAADPMRVRAAEALDERSASQRQEAQSTEAKNAQAKSATPAPGLPRGADVARSGEQERLAELRQRLAMSYAQRNGIYYDPARPDRPLITEEPKKIVAHHTRDDTIRAVVDLAEMRRWNAITATGDKEFQRLVWIEASARGMEVTLRSDRLLQRPYQPSIEDIDTVAKLRAARGVANRVERSPEVQAERTSKDVVPKPSPATPNKAARSDPSRAALARAVGEAEVNANRAAEAATDAGREAPGTPVARKTADLAGAAYDAKERAQVDQARATPATVARVTKQAQQESVVSKADERAAETTRQSGRQRGAQSDRVKLAALDAYLLVRGVGPELRAQVAGVAQAELKARAAQGKSTGVLLVDPAAPRSDVRASQRREPAREREREPVVQIQR